jgi:hypothetical protein
LPAFQPCIRHLRGPELPYIISSVYDWRHFSLLPPDLWVQFGRIWSADSLFVSESVSDQKNPWQDSGEKRHSVAVTRYEKQIPTGFPRGSGSISEEQEYLRFPGESQGEFQFAVQ